jgi:hypothetical protein
VYDVGERTPDLGSSSRKPLNDVKRRCQVVEIQGACMGNTVADGSQSLKVRGDLLEICSELFREFWAVRVDYLPSVGEVGERQKVRERSYGAFVTLISAIATEGTGGKVIAEHLRRLADVAKVRGYEVSNISLDSRQDGEERLPGDH